MSNNGVLATQPRSGAERQTPDVGQEKGSAMNKPTKQKIWAAISLLASFLAGLFAGEFFRRKRDARRAQHEDHI